MTLQTPLEPAPAPVPTPPRRSPRSLAVAIGTIVIGGFVIVGTLLSTGFTAARELRSSDATAPLQQTAVDGVRDLDIEVSGGALTVVFADVSEAQLDGSGIGGWTLEQDGDTLKVATPRRSFADWGNGAQATLTLPQDLERTNLDLRVEVAGGSLDLAGDYGDVDVQVAGGGATVTGSASALSISVSGGSATADVEGVDAATFEVTDGDLVADLTGAAPARTSIEVTAGSADIGLPDDTYRLTSDGPGSVDSALRTSPTATPRIDVQATLGSVTLRTS
uniref:hypothetical protein n=1 Tax=Microbacterium proteolyticum TaxID=1572644 RepID=UPI002417EBFD|nr:hypothetical protein [Microbacterium proteolyticum]